MEPIQIECIDEHTWMISEGTGRGSTHCYVLEGADIAIVIDTGLYVNDLNSIIATLTNKEIHVINTHGHIDHITNNFQFSKVYMHPSDEDVLIQHRSPLVRKPFILERFTKYGITKEQLASKKIQAEIAKQVVLPTQVPYTPLHDGMRIDLGGYCIQIITTQGHTHGSVCILDEAHRRLYSGDSICEDGVLLYFDHSTSVQVYLDSLMKIKQHSSHFDTIYAGHQTVPLYTNIVDDFIQCARNIINGSNAYITFESPLGAGNLSTYQSATIAYLESKIKEH